MPYRQRLLGRQQSSGLVTKPMESGTADTLNLMGLEGH